MPKSAEGRSRRELLRMFIPRLSSPEPEQQAPPPALTMTRRTFGTLALAAVAALKGCAPLEWENEHPSAKEAREKATKTLVKAHNENKLTTPEKLDAAVAQFFTDTENFDQSTLKEDEQTFKELFEKKVDAYVAQLIGIFDDSRDVMHALANHVLEADKQLENKGVFDKKWAAFVAEFKKNGRDIITGLFVWSGAIFDVASQKRFMEGLLNKTISAGSITDTIMNGDDPIQQNIKDAFIQSSLRSYGDFLPQFLMPFALYIVGHDLDPNKAKTIGGRVSLSHAAMMSSLLTTSSDYYPPPSNATKDKMIMTNPPYRREMELASLIKTFSGMDFTSPEGTEVKGLSMQEKEDILNGRFSEALAAKLTGCFLHVFDVHERRISGLTARLGDGASKVKGDHIRLTYFSPVHSKDTLEVKQKKAMVARIKKHGAGFIIKLLGTNPLKQSEESPNYNTDINLVHKMLADLFIRDPDDIQESMCDDSFEQTHLIVQQDKKPHFTYGMPIGESRCMMDPL